MGGKTFPGLGRHMFVGNFECQATTPPSVEPISRNFANEL